MEGDEGNKAQSIILFRNEFVLNKALAAVFNQMGNVEKDIRANPVRFLSNLSTNVFNWAKR